MARESRSVTECLCPLVRVNALNRKLMTSLLLIPQSLTLLPAASAASNLAAKKRMTNGTKREGPLFGAQYVQPRASLTRFPVGDAELARVWRCYVHYIWSVVTFACKLLSVTSTSSLQRCSRRALCLCFNQNQVANCNQSTKRHNYHLTHTQLCDVAH